MYYKVSPISSRLDNRITTTRLFKRMTENKSAHLRRCARVRKEMNVLYADERMLAGSENLWEAAHDRQSDVDCSSRSRGKKAR